MLKLVAGTVLLLVGAETLLRGSERLALWLGIPPVVVAVTVIAFGTSAPELLVSVDAAYRGAVGIALGNVIGSNLCNVALVLGLAALVRPFVVERSLYAFELPLLVLLQGACFHWLLADGVLGRGEGLVLVSIGAAYVAWNVRRALHSRHALFRETRQHRGPFPWSSVFFTLFGLALMPFAAEWIVQGASHLAQLAGVSDRIIGLTVVAVGTSLPEVLTTAVAAARHRSAVAAGTAVGSNVFNLCFVLGTAACVAPLWLPAGEHGKVAFDLGASLGITVLLLLTAWSRQRGMSRLAGLVFVTAYVTTLGIAVSSARAAGP